MDHRTERQSLLIQQISRILKARTWGTSRLNFQSQDRPSVCTVHHGASTKASAHAHMHTGGRGSIKFGQFWSPCMVFLRALRLNSFPLSFLDSTVLAFQNYVILRVACTRMITRLRYKYRKVAEKVASTFIETWRNRRRAHNLSFINLMWNFCQEILAKPKKKLVTYYLTRFCVFKRSSKRPKPCLNKNLYLQI